MDINDKNYRKITVADMAPHVHSFKPNENKVDKIVSWLKNWISLSLECGKIRPYDLLPSKADLACHIGVSQGTMQNAFRLIEDEGYVESKQRVGTYIKGRKTLESEKLTSKRELAIEIIKKYLSENGYKVGDIFISTRKLAQITGISNTTLRMATANLVASGILVKDRNSYIVNNIDYAIENIELKTLVEKVADSLRIYIKENLSSGDKLPSNIELKQIFKTSIKTIHDAVKLLTKEGLLYSRRGQYGTIVIADVPDKMNDLYFYEKFEQKIRHYISENCQAGDKLPTIREFAQKYCTSEKTIKKALDNLAEDGYLTFSRGRYGGTFVLDIPQNVTEAYKWLAISTDYIDSTEN